MRTALYDCRIRTAEHAPAYRGHPGAGGIDDKFEKFAAAVALGLITLGGTAQAQDKGAERPNVKVGDRWVFVMRSTAGEKLLERAWVVTSVSPTRIEGTENGKPLALTPDLSIIKSPREKHSDNRLLSFPLEVGKQWSYVDDYVFNDQIFGTLQGRSKYERCRARLREGAGARG